jgi:6-phosphogluconolactonase
MAENGLPMSGFTVDIKLAIFEDWDRINEFLISKFKEWGQGAIRMSNSFSVALSGGNTPIPFYEKLAGLQGEFPWGRAHFFMVDERFVAFGHPDHSFSQIKRILFDRIDIPESNLHPIDTESSSPDACAESYERELQSYFQSVKMRAPQFDFMLLGMGEDGHTASLFPGSDALHEKKRMVTTSLPAHAPYARITLTYSVINMAKNVLFLITGSSKADMVKGVIEKRDPQYPASRVGVANGTLWFVLDRDAACLVGNAYRN